MEELFRKKLYIFLPYYIMRYEKEFHKISRDTEKTEQLVKEYEQIAGLLWNGTGREDTGMYQDLLRMMRRVADYQLRNETDLKERMGTVMGGKVLELPSDKLREAEEKGRTDGRAEGIIQGTERVNRLNLVLKEHSRMDDIIQAASDKEFQKKLFEEFGI